MESGRRAGSTVAEAMVDRSTVIETMADKAPGSTADGMSAATKKEGSQVAGRGEMKNAECRVKHGANAAGVTKGASHFLIVLGTRSPMATHPLICGLFSLTAFPLPPNPASL